MILMISQGMLLHQSLSSLIYSIVDLDERKKISHIEVAPTLAEKRIEVDVIVIVTMMRTIKVGVIVIAIDIVMKMRIEVTDVDAITNLDELKMTKMKNAPVDVIEGMMMMMMNVPVGEIEDMMMKMKIVLVDVIKNMMMTMIPAHLAQSDDHPRIILMTIIEWIVMIWKHKVLGHHVMEMKYHRNQRKN